MNTCEKCIYGADHGDSVEYIYCERKSRKKDVKKSDCCEHFVSWEEKDMSEKCILCNSEAGE